MSKNNNPNFIASAQLSEADFIEVTKLKADSNESLTAQSFETCVGYANKHGLSMDELPISHETLKRLCVWMTSPGQTKNYRTSYGMPLFFEYAYDRKEIPHDQKCGMLFVLRGDSKTACAWDNGERDYDAVRAYEPFEATVTDAIAWTETEEFIKKHVSSDGLIGNGVIVIMCSLVEGGVADTTKPHGGVVAPSR